MPLRCPECQQTIAVDENAPPMELCCSSCGTAFVEASGKTVTIIRDGSDETVTYVPVSRSSDSPADARTNESEGEGSAGGES